MDYQLLPSSVIRRREDGDERVGPLVVKAVTLRLRAARLLPFLQQA